MARWTTVFATMTILWGVTACVEGVDECTTNEDCAAQANPCQTALCADGECVVATNDDKDGQSCVTAAMTVCQTGLCTAGECVVSADASQAGRPCEGVCSDNEFDWTTAKVCDAAGQCVDGAPEQVRCNNGYCIQPSCSVNGCQGALTDDPFCPDPTNEYLFAIIAEGGNDAALLHGDITVESDAAYTITRLEAVKSTLQQTAPIHGRLQYEGDDTNRLQVAEQTLEFQFLIDDLGLGHEGMIGGAPVGAAGTLLGLAYDTQADETTFNDDYDLLLLTASDTGLLVGTSRLTLSDGAATGGYPLTLYPTPDMSQVLNNPRIVGSAGRMSFQAEGPALSGGGSATYDWPGAVGVGGWVSMFPIITGETFGMGFVIHANPGGVSLETFASTYTFQELRNGGDSGLQINSGTITINDAGNYIEGGSSGQVTVESDGTATVTVSSSAGQVQYRLIAGDSYAEGASELVFAYEIPPAGQNPSVFRILAPNYE